MVARSTKVTSLGLPTNKISAIERGIKLVTHNKTGNSSLGDKNVGAMAKRVAILRCQALVSAGDYPCRQSIAAEKIMANKAQTKIFPAVRSASNHLHIGARQWLSLRSSHAQDVAAGFKAYIKVAVRPQHRGIGNIAGNTAAGQCLPPCELIAAQNFCVNRIHGAMAASSRGKVMQSEDPPGVGLQVNRINIVEKWIESELAGLELTPSTKGMQNPLFKK